LRAVADQQRVVPDDEVVEVDRRAQPGPRNTGDATVGEAERVPVESGQVEKDRHQDAQLAAMGDDKDMMSGLGRVRRVDALDEATRAAAELADALAARRGGAFAVELAARP